MNRKKNKPNGVSLSIISSIFSLFVSSVSIFYYFLEEFRISPDPNKAFSLGWFSRTQSWDGILEFLASPLGFVFFLAFIAVLVSIVNLVFSQMEFADESLRSEQKGIWIIAVLVPTGFIYILIFFEKTGAYSGF